MSTTSLSSYDNCDDYPYNYVFEDSYNTYMQSCQGPFYNTMGQPLVYYAEVQPYCRRSSKGRRKENRNVFARAFNWYTQERVPYPQQYSPELGGFAMWLDAKYGEYLRESECNQSCNPILRSTQEPSTNDTVPCHTNETTTKRFSRMRSPWRKLRGQNRNAGDVPCKTPNGSCQFILQPKDLPRPASECYYQTANCPNKSNITVMSTEIDGTKKTIVKSQSMTSICHENVITPCIDLNNTQEGPKNRQVDAQKYSVVEKAPQVTPSPCDQSCKIKQEGKTGDTIQISSVKVQKTDISGDGGKQGYKPVEQNIGVACDPDCCKTGCKLREQIRLPAKIQNDDPNRCKHECKPMGEIRVPVQAQKFEIPCDSNCSKPAAELHTSTKQQKIEINCDPNCGNRETKPTGETRIASNSQNVDIIYDSNNCCRQECNPTEDIQQDLTKSQIKGIPCDPNCIYKQKPKPVSVTRETVPSQNITTPCDPNCYLPDYKPAGTIQRVFTKSQIKDTPCEPSCIYKQNYKPAREIHVTPTRVLNIETFCDPNCMYKLESKTVSEIQRAPITTEPNYYKQENKPMREIGVPVKLQNVEITCDPNGLYKQGHKPVAEIRRAPLKSRRTEVPCMCYSPKSTSEINKVSSRSQKIDHECQCPEDEALPIDAPVQWESSRQTCASTSTNNTLCKCIFEKALLSPVQAPPCKPIQTTTKVAPTPFVPLHAPQTPQQVKTAEVACQCPENDSIKLDTPSQYDRHQTDKGHECVCQPVKARPLSNMQRPDSRTVTSYSSLAVRQVTRSVTTFRNDGMQTSDHSICLEDVGHDYAFFMKIVCADKLNDCFCDSLIR